MPHTKRRTPDMRSTSRPSLMHSFITGINGFIGTHLAQALRDQGDTVSGLSRVNVRNPHGITVYHGDLADTQAVTRALSEAAPDRIFHLAAQSNVPYSLAHPETTFDVNATGSLRLFEAVRSTVPKATVLSVGSSAEYGRSGQGPDMINEQTLLQPTSPYGASKASQGLLAGLYARAYGLRMIHVRPFAIIGPRKLGDALSDFCRGVVRIEMGGTPTMSVGNLDTVRDFMDVRDCMRAFQLIAERGVAGETYNVCNGVGASLQQILFELQQLTDTRFAVVKDPTRLRPVDDHRLVGNNARLRALGYERQYDLPATVRFTLDAWRVQERAQQRVEP